MTPGESAASVAPPQGSSAVTACLQAILSALDGVAYVVDEAGWVLHAGPAMPGESSQGARNAPSAALAGQNLFAAMQAPEVKAAYRLITARIFGGDAKAVSFEYRCDAPDVRRQMRMSISRLALPGLPPLVLYQSQVLSSVHRPWMSLYEPARIVDYVRSESALPIVRMCSFCQRVSWPPMAGQAPDWLEAEDYYRQGGASDVRVSHGVCRTCSTRLDVEAALEQADLSGAAAGRPAL